MQNHAAEQPRPWRRDALAIAVLVGLATLLMVPIFAKGFPAAFDAVRHYRWTSQFIAALADGAWFPRWLPTANNAQGSPAALYYPPLTFYVGAAFSLIARDTLQGMALSCWLALCLSGVTMYRFSRALLDRRLSVLAAAVYMIAPYHLLDLYQGATVSEFWSFVWLPLLFDGLRRVSASEDWPGIAQLACAYALLVLTHVPMAFLATVILPVSALALTRDWRKLARMAAGVALGAGLGAIFLLPIIFERGYAKFYFKFDYRDYFLFGHLGEAWKRHWFAPDGTPHDYLLDNEICSAPLLLLFLISSLVIWRRGFSKDHLRRFGGVWLVTLIGYLITTRLTATVWRVLPGLTQVYYPYRWMAIAAVGTSLLAAAAVRTLAGDRWRWLWGGAMAAALAANLAMSAAAIARAPHDREALEAGLVRRDTREYRPIWWDGDLRADIWQAPALVASGQADIQPIDAAGIRQSYTITANSDSVIVFRPLYFPGWVAHVDQQRAEVTPADSGNVQLMLAPGAHAVSLSFEDTWPRAAGKIVSATSLVILLGWLLWWRRRRRLQGSATRS
ncbi:MAG TPA: 6-pyruvoyl-tetrahydropterin synthase-related protein [Blastocatellia bacterium]|nr:6-pyruvoyl-tetrahydropterin synthase-related protein [Blastocatellia bacterium]